MTTLLGLLEFTDYIVIWGIVVIFAGGSALIARREVNLSSLERQMRSIEAKLDALLNHEGIAPPPRPASGLSPEVERLASTPSGKIEAIKLHRQQNPGLGLAEAKAKIDAFQEGRL